MLVAMGVAAALLAHWHMKRAWAYDLLGVKVNLGNPIHESSLDSGWNGDGYSFAQYAVSSATLEQFAEVHARGPRGFPSVPTYRSDWHCTSWVRTPVRPEDNPVIEFALEGAPVEAAQKVRDSLQHANSWYARCSKSDDGVRLSNAEIFVLDVKRGILTTSIQNT
jgi:hypothetical protein